MTPATPPPSPWWSPDRRSDRRPRLEARGRIRRAIRSWFEGNGFTEVETAALQVSPGNETHLNAFLLQPFYRVQGTIDLITKGNDVASAAFPHHLVLARGELVVTTKQLVTVAI